MLPGCGMSCPDPRSELPICCGRSFPIADEAKPEPRLSQVGIHIQSLSKAANRLVIPLQETNHALGQRGERKTIQDIACAMKTTVPNVDQVHRLRMFVMKASVFLFISNRSVRRHIVLLKSDEVNQGRNSTSVVQVG